jgi:ribosomal protein S18 acetylase RimI-like enzyme
MMGVSPELVHDRDATRALATLVTAFAGDPVERWLFPDAEQYLRRFPVFLAAFGGRAFDEGTVWRHSGFSAVAMWLPPGAEPDGDAIVAILSDGVSTDRHADTFAVLEQMEAAHPQTPHWYLPWLGVDCALHAQGLGGELLRHGLETVDSSHLPAYLETPSPRSVPFYERHGFSVSGIAQAGACPPLTLMSRDAR